MSGAEKKRQKKRYMLKIDSFAYANKLRKVHPAEKAAFALTTMFLCLIFSSVTLSAVIIILMAGVTVGLAGIPVKIYLRLMFLPFSFLLVGVITVVVSVSAGDTVVGVNAAEWLVKIKISNITLGITSEGLLAAARLFFKSLGTVSCLYFMSLTTPFVEIAMIMRKIKLPALFIELTEIIYRFIFVLLKTAEDIYTSQSSRWGYSSFKNSMNSLGCLTAALFVRSLHRSQELFTTLTARGYTGQLNVLAPKYPVSAANITLIIIVETFLVISAVLLEVNKFV